MEETENAGPENTLIYTLEVARHESLLQGYRQMFLLAETFTLGIAATLLPRVVLTDIFAVFGVVLLVMWVFITTSRTKIILGLKAKARAEGSGVELNPDLIVADRNARILFNLVLPSTFLILWILLIALGT
jgi:hypothetical protein